VSDEDRPASCRVRSFADGAAEVWLRRGHARAAEDCAEALTCFERAEQHRPGDPAILELIGRELLHLGRPDEAAVRLREGWIETRDGTLAVGLARLYTRELADTDAGLGFLVELEEELAGRPDDPDLRCARGEVLAWMEDFEGAEAELRSVLEDDPDHEAAREALAVACNRESLDLYADGCTEQAMFLLKRAMDLAPDWVGLHVNMGRLLLTLGRTERAQQEFERAADGDPQDPLAWFHLGHLLADQGNHAASADAFSRALDLDPDFEGLRPALAGELHELRELDAAIELLEEETTADPSCSICHHNLGLAYHEVGRSGEAVGAFRTAAAEDPGYFRAHYNLAVVLAQLGRFDEALAPLTKALAIDEDKTRQWLALDHRDFAPVAADPRFSPFLSPPDRPS